MNLLLAHWHCILPALIIVVAMFLMRDKKKDGEDDQINVNVLPGTQENKEE